LNNKATKTPSHLFLTTDAHGHVKLLAKQISLAKDWFWPQKSTESAEP
jgi:hypothetical protein